MLNYDELLSNCAFNFTLRPCTVALEAVEVLSADGYERRVVPAAHLAFGGALHACDAMRCDAASSTSFDGILVS